VSFSVSGARTVRAAWLKLLVGVSVRVGGCGRGRGGGAELASSLP
jgi:hypothetical protein